MAVKIRLAKRGRSHLAQFDIVVADSKSPRDGRFIEKLGTYKPVANPAIVDFNADKAFQWLMNGAQPTDTVRNILAEKGLLLKKHLQVGVNKGAITQDVADKKFQDWQKAKEAKLTGEADKAAKGKEDAKKAKLAEEAKKNEARKEALKLKKSAAAELVKADEASAEGTAEEPKAE